MIPVAASDDAAAGRPVATAGLSRRLTRPQAAAAAVAGDADAETAPASAAPPSQAESALAALGSMLTASKRSSWPWSAFAYLASLVPIASWLPHYEWAAWLPGDAVAGVTVGIVVVPQALAYAGKLAALPPQFGLYCGLSGVLWYALFATSKDATIGPTAVLSVLVGQTLSTRLPEGSSDDERVRFALALSFLVGCCQLALGLLRVGALVDFVPAPVVAGFTTGAAVQIVVGQLPALCGVGGVDTTRAPWRVLLAFLRRLHTLPEGAADLAFGVSALAFVVAMRRAAAAMRARTGRRAWELLGVLRNGLAVAIFTALSYAVRERVRLKVVGPVPRGLGSIPAPDLSVELLRQVAPAVPAAVIVSVLEHVAVAKAYGRANGYRPAASQELVAVGASNVAGAFFGAYPATGSFSRSAIMSQSGARSPLAGLFAALVIVVSLYTLTGALAWVPHSTLAGLVTAAVSDLFVSGRELRHLGRAHLADFASFWIALVTTVFATVETAIYLAVAFCLAVLLFRIARPRARLLSRTEAAGWIDADGEGYVPWAKALLPTPAGIAVVRTYEALTFPNSAYLLDTLGQAVRARFRQTGARRDAEHRLWNELDGHGGSSGGGGEQARPRPGLRAVVLDFSAVNAVDYTGALMLLDLRAALSRFAGRPVPFHFAHVRRDQLAALWELPLRDPLAVGGGGGGHGGGHSGSDSRDSATARSRVDDGGEGGGSGGEERPLLPVEEESGGWTPPANPAVYFHLSVDEAVAAADQETLAFLDDE
ncbi:hypothetical protein HK405_008361 [Cladochytrium tenue]|nr:hypothetical protein HK405_008361 [Cladochytrium tenue]